MWRNHWLMCRIGCQRKYLKTLAVWRCAHRTLHAVIILRLLCTLLFFFGHIRMNFIFRVQTQTHTHYTGMPSVRYFRIYSQNVFSHQLAATSTIHCRMSYGAICPMPMPRYYSIFVLHSIYSITRKASHTHSEMSVKRIHLLYISLQVGLLKCFCIRFPI